MMRPYRILKANDHQSSSSSESETTSSSESESEVKSIVKSTPDLEPESTSECESEVKSTSECESEIKSTSESKSSSASDQSDSEASSEPLLAPHKRKLDDNPFESESEGSKEDTLGTVKPSSTKIPKTDDNPFESDPDTELKPSDQPDLLWKDKKSPTQLSTKNIFQAIPEKPSDSPVLQPVDTKGKHRFCRIM